MVEFRAVTLISLVGILFCKYFFVCCDDSPTRGLHVFRHGRVRTPPLTGITEFNGLNSWPRLAKLRTGQRGKVLDESAWISRRKIRQRVDHFDGSNTKRWGQVYWMNNRYHKQGGPIFLYISSGPIGDDRYWIGGGGALPDWIMKAKKFGALCFLLEHRYYGENRPTMDLSVSNMKYLNTYQSLADIAKFITNATREYDLNAAPWVLFGCSYAGALAAWSRLKYPHLVSMAVTSGAPVQPKMDFSEYAEEVTKILKRESNTCVPKIENATKTLELFINDNGKRPQLKYLFSLCEDVDANDKKNISVLFAHLAENVFNVVQESKVNRGIFKHNLTTTTICHIMDSGSGDNLTQYAAVQRAILSFHGLPCLSISYKDLIESLKDIRYDQNDDWRQWSYQVCNEFGFCTTSNSPYQPFGHKFDLEYYLNQCTDIFGPWLRRPVTESNIEETLRQYGGNGLRVTKVIFTYGTDDPWKSLGPSSVPDSSRIITIEGSSHCADFYAPDPSTDSKALTKARKRVDKILEKWMKDFASSGALKDCCECKLISAIIIGAVLGFIDDLL